MSLTETIQDEVPNVMRHRWGAERSRDATPRLLSSVIAIALVVTFALCAVIAYQTSSYAGGPRSLPWLVLAAAVFLVGLRMALRLSDVSPWIWLCSLMLVLHLAMLGAVQGLFLYLVERHTFIRTQLHEAQGFRVGSIVLAMAGVLVFYQWWAGRGGRQRDTEIIRRLYIAVLGFILVLGLWAPIFVNAVDVFENYFRWESIMVLSFREGVMYPILLPPLLAALLLCIPRVEQFLLSKNRGYDAHVVIGILLTLSVIHASYELAVDSLEEDFIAYLTCFPIFLGSGAVCLLLIACMGASHWRALRGRANLQDEAAIEGTVVALADDEPTGHVFYEGWLAGLRMQTGAFVLRGTHGDLPIPAGTRLVASLPAWTVGARVGESTPVLAAGDHVTVHGFTKNLEDGPFRASHLPQPGKRGIVAVKTEPSVQFWREFSLLVWRPTIAYLAIAIIVAIPGLVGLCAYP